MDCTKTLRLRIKDTHAKVLCQMAREVSYGLMDYELRAGRFSQDSRGRWYFNVAVEVQRKPSPGTAAVGIDLGLKDCATVSTTE